MLNMGLGAARINMVYMSPTMCFALWIIIGLLLSALKFHLYDNAGTAVHFLYSADYKTWLSVCSTCAGKKTLHLFL